VTTIEVRYAVGRDTAVSVMVVAVDDVDDDDRHSDVVRCTSTVVLRGFVRWMRHDASRAAKQKSREWHRQGG
jgi:hypothetical protein